MTIKEVNISILALCAFIGISCISAIADESAAPETNSAKTEVVSEKIKANKSTLEKSQEAIQNKDYDTAITYLNGYINAKQKNYEPYKLRGDAYYAIRRYDLAKADYQKAVDIKAADDKILTETKYISAVILGADKNEQRQNPELGDLYGRLMYAQKALNDPAYATSYENALKYNTHIYLPKPKKSDIPQINTPQKYGKVLNPQGIDVSIYGAIDDIEKENFNEALYKLQNVTSQYPKYYLGYYLTGVALSGLEKYEDAKHSFDKSISLNPYDFESYASLGQIYYDKAETTFSSEDAKKSIEYFNKALKYNSNCYLYYFYIGLNNLQTGNINTAIANFDKALSLNFNDYNSIYYKSIAKYNAGDYESVINLTTSLLYKHVSNSNSVLYLRALAYYKQGNEEKALADLDTVQNNINDIYNMDIKKVSEKEKTLDSYIHYLKAQIAHEHGYGAAADEEQAKLNPIIAQLSKVERAMYPYEKTLQGETIAIKDFKKYEAFYNTGLPKLLNSGIKITEQDIDNQYDYIRTTFDDIGISFVYKNPDYKMSIIDNYPYKKYAKKLSNDDIAQISNKIPEELKQNSLRIKEPELKQKTSAQGIIGDDSKISLAQMLATKDIPNNITLSNNKEQNTETLEPQNEVDKDQKTSNIADGEPFIFIDKKDSLLNNKNSNQINDLLQEEKNNDKSSIKTKEISKNNQEDKSTKITEKHANINPQDFGVKPKKELVINQNDEIIHLDTTKLKDNALETNKKTNETEKENSISIFNQTKEDAKNTIKIRETEISQKSEDKNNSEKMKQSEPAVVVPDFATPETDKNALSLRPKDSLSATDTSEAKETNTSNVEQKIINIKTQSEEKIDTETQKIIEKAQKEQEKINEKINAQQLKEQKNAQIAQAKILAQQEKEIAYAKAAQIKAEKKAAAEKAKAEKERIKAEKKAQKEKAKQEAKAKALQLKKDRAEEKARIKAEKEKAKENSLKGLDTEAKTSEKKYEIIYPMKKTDSTFTDTSKKESEQATKKTVIKSIETKE